MRHIRIRLAAYILLPVVIFFLFQCNNMAAEGLPIVLANFEYGHIANGISSTQQPRGWFAMAWQRDMPSREAGGMTISEHKDGAKALEIPATDKGMLGWRSMPQKIIRPARQLTVSGWVKCSADYTGNSPMVFLTWFNGASFLSSTFISMPAVNAKDWTYFEYEFPADETPSDADNYQLNLAARKEVGAAEKGRLYFDSVVVRIARDHTLGGKVRMQAQKFANWWVMGEQVLFKPEKILPGNAVSITGDIYDSSNRLVESIELPAEEINKNGWGWKPKSPGLYHLRFSARDTTGKVYPLIEEYLIPAWNVFQFGLKQRDEFEIAVAPADARKPETVSPLFGFHVSADAHNSKKKTETEISLASLVEANFIRLHDVRWSDIEPQKGEYDWGFLDNNIDRCEAAGFRPVINFLSTPRWASPHPDEEMVDICVVRYTAYAPKEIKYWKTFVTKMVERYKNRVDTWEVWNEQHLPGQSCYWQDSPENYLKLLSSAYEIIKKGQPSAKVWIGGMANRYLPFYDRLMSLGAGSYFDSLAFHGFAPRPELFKKIDRRYKSPAHSLVSSEWHALLVRYSMPELYNAYNDITLSRRMLVDLLQQIKDGCEHVAMFELINLTEWEDLKFHADNGAPMMHSSGMFRSNPRLEPRFPAIVWRNFSDNFQGKVKYVGEYKFGAQRVVALKSELGNVLVVWHEKDNAQEADPEIVKAVGAKSVINDWQGRVVSDNPYTLEPDTVYYIRNPEETFMKWPLAKAVLVSEKKSLVLNGPNGKYITEPLIDRKAGRLMQKQAAWNTADWQTSGGESIQGPRFALALTDEGLDIVVESVDAMHFQQNSDGQMWQGDGVEFAIDVEKLGYPADRLEFQAALTPKGPIVFKTNNPDIGGDLPTEWTPQNNIAKYALLWTKKLKNGMRYLIHIKKSELYPYSPSSEDTIRFSLLINNNDGKGRTGWVEWGAGIGKSKDPTLYGTLEPVK